MDASASPNRGLPKSQSQGKQGMGASLRRLFRFASQEVRADGLTDGSQEGSFGRGSGSKPGTGPSSTNSGALHPPWGSPHPPAGGAQVKKQQDHYSQDPQSVLDLDDRSSLATDRSSAVTADRSSAATIDRSSVGSSSRGSGSSRLVAMLRSIIRSPGNPGIDAGATLHGPISVIPEAAEDASPTPPSTGGRAVHQQGGSSGTPSSAHQRIQSPSASAALQSQHHRQQHGTPTKSSASLASPSVSRETPPPTSPQASPVPAPLTSAAGSQQLSIGSEGLLIVCEALPLGMARARWRVEDYIVLSKCHAGYASAVYKATCKFSSLMVALKVYQPAKLHEISQYQLQREARLQCGMNHPNIIKLYAAFQQEDSVILVQEWADGGDLLQLLMRNGTRLSERRATQLVLQPLLRALHYLHSHCTVHRDIKLENILFTGPELTLKLADFGLCLNLNEERSVTRAGTLDYMAPEVLRCPQKHKPLDNKERDDLAYTAAVDIWALGVVTYELLNGCPPFTCHDKKETEQRINSGLMPEFVVDVSEAAVDFTYMCLSRAPHRRPSAWQLLRHPWLKANVRGSTSNLLEGVMSPSPAKSSAHASPAAAAAPSPVADGRGSAGSSTLSTPYKPGSISVGASAGTPSMSAQVQAKPTAVAAPSGSHASPVAPPPASPPGTAPNAQAKLQQGRGFPLTPYITSQPPTPQASAAARQSSLHQHAAPSPGAAALTAGAQSSPQKQPQANPTCSPPAAAAPVAGLLPGHMVIASAFPVEPSPPSKPSSAVVPLQQQQQQQLQVNVGLAHVQEVEVTSRGAAGMALGHSISMPAQGHTAGGGAAGGPVGSRRLEKNVTIGEGPGATSQVIKEMFRKGALTRKPGGSFTTQQHSSAQAPARADGSSSAAAAAVAGVLASDAHSQGLLSAGISGSYTALGSPSAAAGGVGATAGSAGAAAGQQGQPAPWLGNVAVANLLGELWREKDRARAAARQGPTPAAMPPGSMSTPAAAVTNAAAGHTTGPLRPLASPSSQQVHNSGHPASAQEPAVSPGHTHLPSRRASAGQATGALSPQPPQQPKRSSLPSTPRGLLGLGPLPEVPQEELGQQLSTPFVDPGVVRAVPGSLAAAAGAAGSPTCQQPLPAPQAAAEPRAGLPPGVTPEAGSEKSGDLRDLLESLQLSRRSHQAGSPAAVNTSFLAASHRSPASYSAAPRHVQGSGAAGSPVQQQHSLAASGGSITSGTSSLQLHSLKLRTSKVSYLLGGSPTAGSSGGTGSPANARGNPQATAQQQPSSPASLTSSQGVNTPSVREHVAGSTPSGTATFGSTAAVGTAGTAGTGLQYRLSPSGVEKVHVAGGTSPVLKAPAMPVSPSSTATAPDTPQAAALSPSSGRKVIREVEISDAGAAPADDDGSSVGVLSPTTGSRRVTMAVPASDPHCVDGAVKGQGGGHNGGDMHPSVSMDGEELRLVADLSNRARVLNKSISNPTKRTPTTGIQ